MYFRSFSCCWFLPFFGFWSVSIRCWKTRFFVRFRFCFDSLFEMSATTFKRIYIFWAFLAIAWVTQSTKRAIFSLHCDGSKAKRIDSWSIFCCSFSHSYGLHAMTNVVFHSKVMYIWMKNEKWKRSREKWEKCCDMKWIAIIINGIVKCWYIFSNSLCLLSVLYFLSLQTVCSFIWIFRTFSCGLFFFFFFFLNFRYACAHNTNWVRIESSVHFSFSSFTLVLVGYFRCDYIFNFSIRPVFFLSLNFFRSIACDSKRKTYVISFQCIFGWILCVCLYCFTVLRISRENFI